MAIDVDPDRLPELGVCGADRALAGDWEHYTAANAQPRPRTLILGNPPYRAAESHIRAALSWMARGDVLAFLLRLNFLGSLGRVPLWRETPLAAVVPVVPRPSFTGGGSDATEYAVFVWEAGYAGRCSLAKPLVWRPERVD